jgi:hypothetical protein
MPAASMSILFWTIATTTCAFRVIRNAIVTVVTNTGMIIVGGSITTIETKDVVATEGRRNHYLGSILRNVEGSFVPITPIAN